MDTKDYYAVLGITENASSDEIKKAYRKLALQYHPDRVSGTDKKAAEEKFKDIAAAYYVLGDEQRRKEYDDYRKGAYEFRSGHGSGDFASQSGFDFDDLIRHFSNLGQRGKRRKRADSRYFYFDDLSDIFSEFSSMQGDSGEHYNANQFYEDAQGKQNTDISANLNLPKKIAVHGGEVKFKLHDGRMITLKIATGTKNGQKLKLKGMGKMCPTCDHKGDLIVSVHYS